VEDEADDILPGVCTSMLGIAIDRKPEEIDRQINKAASKSKHSDEYVFSTRTIWMPYHRIRISCNNTDTSSIQSVETTLNAVFCAFAGSEHELLQLFRPRHLEKRLSDVAPDPAQLVCSPAEADLDAIVGRLMAIRAQATGELPQIERQLVRSYRRMQWLYLFLPTSTSSIERDSEVADRLAELKSKVLAVDICLNLRNNLVPVKVEDHDIFYAPMAVVHYKHRETESDRRVLVDLTTGRIDEAMTNLCETNSEFKTALQQAIRPTGYEPQA